MAYDSESDRVILFGGRRGYKYAPNKHSGATWAYDVTANQWMQMEPASGPSRRASALAYDSESDRVILFGGGSTEDPEMEDTWAYDYNTNTWTQMSPGPVSHRATRIAYDVESDRIILFGGSDPQTFDDTWAYDFNTDTWIEMKPKTFPPGRNDMAMTYDSKADWVLVWGAPENDEKPIDDRMWAYDYNTNTWTGIPPGDGPHPDGRDYTAMAYDAESDRTVMFGGWPKAEPQTWLYDYNTNTWTPMPSSSNPGDLSGHAMTYSTAADRIILFGGQYGYIYFDFRGDTWTYDLNTNTWTNMSANP